MGFAIPSAMRKSGRRELPALTGIEPTVCAITLGVMDLLYGFFLAVQSAALFGGAEYLSRVPGLSYAEYARSGFFQLVFVACLNLALNACNVDRVVAEYNVALYQRQETALLDMDYMVNSLSYDALDALEKVTFPRRAQNAKMEYAIRACRARAAEEASHWQTWSLSAWLASK